MNINDFKYLLVFVAVSSCLHYKPNEPFVEFKIPEIINSQFSDTIQSKPFKAEFVSEVFPTFAGKYKFQDTIDVNLKNLDSIISSDFIEEIYYLKVGDSLDVNGFEIYVDYDKTIKYNRYYFDDSTLYDHYPVFFVNSTHSDKIFLAKDSYVFGIQEALDTNERENWKPIEGRGFDFCGNGRWGLIVHPGEFVLVLMNKYEGNFKTAVRVRFQIGESIYVSKPFMGSISENQFNIKDSSHLDSELQQSNGAAASWLFYGAVPKDGGWAVKTF